METFIYGFIAAIALIAFLVFGFFSVLGGKASRYNPAALVVVGLMKMFDKLK